MKTVIYLFNVVFFLISFCLDRLVKYYSYINRYELLKGINFIPNIVILKYTENNGISFGMFQNNIIFKIIIPCILILILSLYLIRIRDKKLLVYLAAVLGAFVSNIFDRLFFKYVIDMIFFPFLPFFICNIADIIIFVFSILIAIRIIKLDERNGK